MNTLKVLMTATEDLLFPSETDAPFTPILFEGQSMADFAPGEPVKAVSLCDFFQCVMQLEEWHDAEEIKTVMDFRALVQIIQILIPDAKVFCVGERQLECLIVGTMGNDVGGLNTIVVET